MTITTDMEQCREHLGDALNYLRLIATALGSDDIEVTTEVSGG